MKKKKIATLLVTACMMASMLAGCTAGATSQEVPSQGEKADVTTEAATKTLDEENYNTGDAALDNARNQDGIGEKELLVVSFGTSYNDSRRLTIGAIEDAIEKAFPEYSVRRGFTSQIIIDHVKSRDNVAIDNVGEALERAIANGVKTLVIQPTHLMNGFEYNDLIKEVAEYAKAFDKVVIGEPLLTSDEDFQIVMKAIVKATEKYDDGQTAICFMGHGTQADSNGVYERMQKVLDDAGKTNYFVGTVEAEPSLEDVLAAVQAGNYKRVVLRPLMIVAGDHANNDMAGNEEDSWKSVFEAAGYEVWCVVEGLGQLEEIQQLFVEHAASATTEIMAAEKTEDVTMATGTLEDGTYGITVDSNSSMFKVVSCDLTVENGKMTATLTLSGTGYTRLFMGTGDEAQKAEEGFIPYVENAQGQYTFTIPVEALDQEINCAAFSQKKSEWYDRILVFRGDSLKASGSMAENKEEAASETGAGIDNALADGSYTVEVRLSGGTGKATVVSPAEIKVADGKIEAVITWTSSNYDYMKVNDVKYDAVSREPASVFEIPVAGFDQEIPVIADTVAMGNPHEIEYVLYFDSNSVAKK